jgi:hypothetical protein
MMQPSSMGKDNNNDDDIVKAEAAVEGDVVVVNEKDASPSKVAKGSWWRFDGNSIAQAYNMVRKWTLFHSNVTKLSLSLRDVFML